VRTGSLAGVDTPDMGQRLVSFVVEKALGLLILAPYIVLMGAPSLVTLLVASMTVGSTLAAVVLVIGHINTGLSPSASAPEGRTEWAAHLVRTSASFRTESRVARWVTGGMTHHLAHHLRATAPRAELPTLHRTTVADIVAASDAPLVEYATFAGAVRGHWRVLRDLGQRAVPIPDGQQASATGPLLARPQ